MINVERSIRETCRPHEDIVSTSEDPDQWECSVSHDACTISNVSPELLRLVIPADHPSVICLSQNKLPLLLDIVRYQMIVRHRKTYRQEIES